MEDPSQSSMGKSHCSKEATPLSEESGWTSYLEDFLASQKKEGSSTSSGFSPSVGGGSSMVSDATSCVAWRPPAHAEPSKGCKKLCFKKRKAKLTLGDDPLEDTASSPLNSPKVGDLNYLGVDLRKEEDDRKISPVA
ncbi:vascular-relatedprotein 1-like [Cocos nucifera]|nr:vascular-relatedprotein 1-like [Cocos nucifera]